jgi:hypothetical protein
MGGVVGARTVDVVMMELTPSEEGVLEARKPGKCEGPTLRRGGR